MTGLNIETLKPLLVLCLLLHDIGKFSESFQYLIPDWFKEGFRSYKVTYSKSDFGHDSIGGMFWHQSLSKAVTELYSQEVSKSLELILEPAFGHHGKPIEKARCRAGELLDDYYSERDIESVHGFFEIALDIAEVKTVLHEFHKFSKHQKTNIKKASWLISGLYTICDWIGSNKQFFHYIPNNKKYKTLDMYWKKSALNKAKDALIQAGILPCQSREKLNALDLLSNLPKDVTLSPLQELVNKLELGSSSQLFIIEDATGAGKTEAALLLTHRLMCKGLANGFYFALPTMATADGVYPRVQKIFDNFYAEGEKPSLILSHSSSKLSEKFTKTIIYTAQIEQEQKYEDDATSRCLVWLTDNRKKSLLAHIGVGTIDQVFLAVLENKYLTLRLFGLLGKVLIVDEAHAYDAYMGKELEVLIQVHSALGGSTIIMSATLPYHIRQKMIDAYYSGLEQRPEKIRENESYPLLTHIENTKPIYEIPIKTRKDIERTIQIEEIHNLDSVKELIEQSLQAGKCVCWIRNSVKDARLSAQELKQFNPILFHARFTMGQRLEIQENVLKIFGNGRSEERRGKLLIATQVVEQSLDLDFDVMITDLAPIDLMLQRAGRLHRHVRDKHGNIKLNGADERGTPILYILTPVFTKTPSSNWIKGFFTNSQAVYGNHARLWLGLKVLNDIDNKKIIVPKDYRKLVEKAYETDAFFPESLTKFEYKSVGNDTAEKHEADFNTINFNRGYRIENTLWAEDIYAPTRLGEETITLTLAYWEDGILYPLMKEMKRPWVMSEIRVLVKNILGQSSDLASLKKDLLDKSKKYIESMSKPPKSTKWLNLVPMTYCPKNQHWEGEILNNHSIYYSHITGFVYHHELQTKETG